MKLEKSGAPKSNTRFHGRFVRSLTQAAIVKSVQPATMPGGSATYCPEPASVIALPISPRPKLAPPTIAPDSPSSDESATMLPRWSSSRQLA